MDSNRHIDYPLHGTSNPQYGAPVETSLPYGQPQTSFSRPLQSNESGYGQTSRRDDYQHTDYAEHRVSNPQQQYGAPVETPLSYTQTPSAYPQQMQSQKPPREIQIPSLKDDFNSLLKTRKINKKWQQRLYWLVPIGILVIVLAVLFEVYKSDFERWVSPLTDWLREREAWSWTIPTAILVILSFPPLFGHEIVQLVVGLTYPLGVAIGIACAGAVLGEAACFIVFKYLFTGWVDKKIASKIRWAAISRVTQEAGFRGVLVIRYSIVPPHLANPLFSCTGMKFWLYMVTVILSLPKSIVFVALGNPSSENSKGAKYGKVVAIAILIIVTIFASLWIRRKMAIATAQIESERGIVNDNEELGMLGAETQRTQTMGTDDGRDTSYHGGGYHVPPGQAV